MILQDLPISNDDFESISITNKILKEKVNQRTHTTQPKSLREGKPKDPHNTAQIFERR
jgi:hypothetical protein